MTVVLTKKYEVEICSITSLSPSVKMFGLQFPKGVQFDFQAGQFVIITKTNDSVKRSYSIASRSSIKNMIEIVVRKKEGGVMTSWLHSLPEGTKLGLQGPYGRFLVKDNELDKIFISAGAGIAPFRSMIESYFECGGRGHITLFAGFHSEQDFFFREELETLAKEHKNFTLIPTISQPGPSWSGEKGRVTAILPKYVNNAKNKDVYLCGPPPMIEDTMQTLKKMGFLEQQIIYEQWGS